MQQITNIQTNVIEDAINKYGEIVLKKNKNNLIIMTIDEYKENLFSEDTISSLLKAEDDIENERTRNGVDVVRELNEKHELQ